MSGGHPFLAVIAAGGAGSRLWPRSRKWSPKHVLPLSGTGKPLLRETYERIADQADRVYVLTEEAQVGIIREILPDLADDQLIAEPAARGTTSAYGLAALTLAQRHPDATVICTPADHVVRGAPAYRKAVRSARAFAETGRGLVTIGLKPRHAATGFGYIQAGDPVGAGRARALTVRRFVEKPDAETAAGYLADGAYYWNLAMFCFRLDVFGEELRRHSPDHARGLEKVLRAREAGDEAAAGRAYRRLPLDAIDYAVMERTDRLFLVPAAFEWADVGSWSELADLLRQDGRGNVIEGDPLLIDVRDCFISVPDKLVAAIGVSDLVVVDTPDALLVCPKDRAQDVKQIVEALGRDRARARYL